MSAPTAVIGAPDVQAQQVAAAAPQQLQQQHLIASPAAGAVPAAQPAAAAAAGLPPPGPSPAAAATAAVPPPGPAATAATTPAAAGAGSLSAASRFAKCGFAKLLGDNGLEYYIKKYEIVLGRRSKASNLDVVLGDSPVLSRQHARITYSFGAKRWELHVEGKNGVTVNGTLYTPTTGPCVLNSQDLLQAGDHNFYFLLPKQQRKRAPKGSKAATPAASEGAAPQQQQQAVPSPRLGVPAGQQQQQQQQQQHTPGLGPAMDGPQLGGSSPGLPGVTGFNGMAGLLNPAQPYTSGPLLPGMNLYGNGTGLNGDVLQQQTGWGSELEMGEGFNTGLGDLGEDPSEPKDMED